MAFLWGRVVLRYKLHLRVFDICRLLFLAENVKRFKWCSFSAIATVENTNGVFKRTEHSYSRNLPKPHPINRKILGTVEFIATDAFDSSNCCFKLTRKKKKMNRAHTKKESIKRTCSRSWKRKETATATTTTIFETEQRILSTIEIPMLPLLRHFAAVATTAKPIPMKGHTATTIDEKQSMFSRAFDSLRFGILS